MSSELPHPPLSGEASTLSFPIQSCAVDGHGGGLQAAANEVVPSEAEGTAGKKTKKLEFCVFLCDFLFGIPQEVQECWDEEMFRRIVAGLSSCPLDEEDSREYSRDSGKNIITIDGLTIDNIEDTVTIDIRGQYIVDAIAIFLRRLRGCSLLIHPLCSLKTLDVVVGCKKHGVGNGKLKKEVIRWLIDEEITWVEKYKGGSVISIPLSFRKDFKFRKFTQTDSYDSDTD